MPDIKVGDQIFRFPDGMSDADMAAAIDAELGISRTPEKKQSLGGVLYENLIGSGEVDTPGERLGELIRGAGAGAARGMADVLALPGNAQQAVMGASNWAREKIGIDPIDPQGTTIGRVIDAIPTSEDTRGLLSTLTGGESDYRAPGVAGDYIATASEFAGGAGLASGPSAALRYGAAPGLASELAGKATEGTALEPVARIAAPIATAVALTPRPTQNTIPGERGQATSRLQERGVRPSAGQARDSEALMRVEDTLGPTGRQLDQFTRAALRETGYAGKSARATPGVLRMQQEAITKRMNEIVDVDVPITPKLSVSALRVADDYLDDTAGKMLPPNLRRVANELADAATDASGKPIPGTSLRKWRTDLGRYTTSSEEATRDAAHALREIIDSATEDALVAMGRAKAVSELGDLRTKYRNLLVITDATTRGNRQGASGVLTPERVAGAAKRIFGRPNYAMGKGTDLSELTRDAEMIIGAMPTVKPGAIRDILTAGSGAIPGAIVGAQGGSIGTALAGAAAGAAAPTLGRELMRTGVAQSAMMNPENLLRGLPSVMPGLLAN